MHAAIVALVVTTWVMCPIPASAQPVPAGYQQVARAMGVPPGLLYAVALTESGQSVLSGGEFRPWPWALNIDGQGHFYPTRQHAWEALQVALTRYQTSVDIGLMQISWRYHQRSLGSTWQALDPYHNLQVAAAILRACFAQHSAWLPSAGCYHAPHDAERAQRYRERVEARSAQLTPTAIEVGP